MKYKLVIPYILLNGLFSIANAANIAYVAKAAPGDTATAGAGKQWPTTRFVVKGDCVSDNLTGLMWAKNGNLLGSGFWNDGAVSGSVQYKVAQMNTNPGAPGYLLCGYNDWRLPAITELLSMVNFSAIEPASWLNNQGFVNIQSDYYWTSTAGSISTDPGPFAWGVFFIPTTLDLRISAMDYQNMIHYVWPVRGGLQ